MRCLDTSLYEFGAPLSAFVPKTVLEDQGIVSRVQAMMRSALVSARREISQLDDKDAPIALTSIIARWENDLSETAGDANELRDHYFRSGV